MFSVPSVLLITLRRTLRRGQEWTCLLPGPCRPSDRRQMPSKLLARSRKHGRQDRILRRNRELESTGQIRLESPNLRCSGFIGLVYAIDQSRRLDTLDLLNLGQYASVAQAELLAELELKLRLGRAA